MRLAIKRDVFREDCTLGRASIAGEFDCYTLEPPVRGKKPRAIPEGTYKLKLYDSPKFGMKVPLLLDVPDFEYVEIHIGNFPRQTRACILVGQGRGDDYLTNSRKAFEQLMKKIRPAIERGEATLEITT